MDGSEDALINIKDIVAYKMPLPEKEFQMIEKTDSEDDDDNDEFEEPSSESDSDSMEYSTRYVYFIVHL